MQGSIAVAWECSTCFTVPHRLVALCCALVSIDCTYPCTSRFLHWQWNYHMIAWFCQAYWCIQNKKAQQNCAHIISVCTCVWCVVFNDEFDRRGRARDKHRSIHNLLSERGFRWKGLLIGTINSTHSLWWSNQEPSISPRRGCRTSFQTMENWGKSEYESKLVQKLYDENIWHVNITNQSYITILLGFFVVILVKFYCFTTPFVPKLKAKSVVLEMTTRGSKHCWWSLSTLLKQLLK